jgi:hypothetical protein
MKKIINFFNNKSIFILFVFIHIQFSTINSYSQSSIDSLIEKILVTEHTIDPQLKRLNDKDNNYSLSVKNDSRKLTYEDIIILKQLYTIWWQNNKEKLNENNNSHIQNAIVKSNYQWEFCDLNYDLENGFY